MTDANLSHEMVLFNDGHQWRPAIARHGRKSYTLVCYQDSFPYRVTTRTVANSESRYFKPLDYDVKKAARRYRSMGVRSMTKAARRIIEEVLS